MNRPNNNSFGLLAVISVGMFVLALVYHMLIGGRGFLAAILFALIFALIIAALIYLFLMTSIGMEWSQSAKKKIEEKTGSAMGKADESQSPADAESETRSSAEPAAEEASAAVATPAASAPEPAPDEEATATKATPAAPTPEPAAEDTTVASIASEAPTREPSAETPAEPAPSETPRVEPTRVAPSRIIEPTPAEPAPVEPTEPTPIVPPPEAPPRVEPTRVKSRRLEPISAPSKTDMSQDYDRDGVLEGTNEGTRPAGLDAPRGGNADDLKMIKGVGPKLEKICNSLGFWHFDQVAAWSDDEAAWVDANLQGFKGRVSRDRWVEQAKTLAAGGETEFSKRVEGGDVY